MTKKRLQKKYFKRVAVGLRTGQPIPRFYITKTVAEIERYFFIAYITGFRPWWWEQTDRQLDFVVEHNRWHDKKVIEFENSAGFKMEFFNAAFKEYKSTRRRQKRKPRREKPVPPMHRIKGKDQRSYIINTKDGPMAVIGAEAFTYKGYEFFMFPDGEDGDQWNISDFKAGRRLYLGNSGEGYKTAIRRARKRLVENFDKYEAKLFLEGLI